MTIEAAKRYYHDAATVRNNAVQLIWNRLHSGPRHEWPHQSFTDETETESVTTIIDMDGRELAKVRVGWLECGYVISVEVFKEE